MLSRPALRVVVGVLGGAVLPAAELARPRPAFSLVERKAATRPRSAIARRWASMQA